eukprot:TRINITY_DN564_c0_g1_i1.p1 TRINITY_DN564_c0_g1~~TRINITY_DN564_c0_g1_i1.p1  ORF type:complete len:122 (+),score=35.83 TRINITY_DN564_c0_g1_i1:66-431(+)
MCIRDRYQRRVHGIIITLIQQILKKKKKKIKMRTNSLLIVFGLMMLFASTLSLRKSMLQTKQDGVDEDACWNYCDTYQDAPNFKQYDCYFECYKCYRNCPNPNRWKTHECDYCVDEVKGLY